MKFPSIFNSFWFKLFLVVAAGLIVFYFNAWFQNWAGTIGMLLFREGRIEETIFLILIVVLAWLVLRKLLSWLAKIESK